MSTREQRRLAAIVAADVVGYSRLMGRDESGTLARLREHRTQRLEPTLARHGGRLVKLTGDGALVEFGSAVDALNAAIEFQEAMAEANQDQPEDRRIIFRIGLHLGDLIVDGDDLYGDGVNVAARLEAEALAGGIVLSGSVHDAVVGRLKAAFEDLGELSLKNIERPVRAYRVRAEGMDASSAAVASSPSGNAPLTLPDKPSIAVLPFQNMSGDPEQEYFVDGLVEDITTALSRNRGLFVIARNSSFTYKGRAVDIRQVSRELGVRYVLEGSVRKAANRLRITAQLIEAETGAHMWADRIDGALEDVFELQDKVTEKVVAALTPSVDQAEIDRAIRKTTNLKAYDFYLKAMMGYSKMTPRDLDDALGFAKQCLALDPTYARCHALIAGIYSSKVVISSSNDLSADAAAAERSARTAFELDTNDATILMQYGQVLWQSLGRREEGVALLERAIALDPNLAPAWSLCGMGKGGLGKTAEAISDLEQALRLSPRDPRRWIAQHGLAWAHFLAGRYDEALSWAAMVLQLQPNLGFTLRVVIAANAQLGRHDKACEALATHMSIEPDARISTLRASYLRRVTPQAFGTLVEGLRKAGFPE